MRCFDRRPFATLALAALSAGCDVVADPVSEPIDTVPAAAAVEPPPPPEPAPPPPLPPWPLAGAGLRDVAAEVPADWKPMRVLIDAGHGALGNDGNTSSRCEEEQDFTRRVQDDLVDRLATDVSFEVHRTRPTASLVPYNDRLAMAHDWPADALIGLHSDAREAQTLVKDPVTGCPTNHGYHGFSVLYADEHGSDALIADRKRLAEVIAARLVEAGFPPYRWDGYYDLYDGDPEHPGVFVDRHEPKKRIKMLRAPQVPAVIVETHQALDPDEAARWEEERTREVFARAVRAALIDFRGP